MKAIRVLIADDHPVVRQGLRWLIETEPDIEVVGEAGDGLESVEAVGRLQPDVVLLDLMMPRRDGIWALGEMAQQTPQAKVLVLTSFADDEKVVTAIKAGALGYLLKDSPPQVLLDAIREVAAGGSPIPPAIARKLVRQMAAPARPQVISDEELTEREVEVLALIAKGLCNQDIAESLVLSERTVRCHVSSILHKLHLNSRTQAALYALREGIAQLQQPSPKQAH
jgi:NarL family two-component system response regulator LiaR